MTTTLSGTGLQTGTITLIDGGVVIGAIDVQAGTPSYTYGTSVLAVGPHTLQATNTGDTNNAPSASSVEVARSSEQHSPILS